MAEGRIETTVFGGGCFWCTEAVFLQLNGVASVMPGYAGGKMPNPRYDDVSTGRTGHAEVIKIEYDPAVITFEKLLEVFFSSHDPTTPNRQGADIGEQYRSIVLYATEAQRNEAEAYIRGLITAKKYSQPIVTQVRKLEAFYPAEEYHKNFYARNPEAPYSQAVIAPKIRKVSKEYKELLK